MMLQDKEKLIAFVLLGAGVLFLAALVMFKSPSNDYALRIIDAAVGGFLLALGSAANALFRIGSTDQQNADTLEKAVDKLPPPTGEAAVTAEQGGLMYNPENDGAAPWNKYD